MGEAVETQHPPCGAAGAALPLGVGQALFSLQHRGSPRGTLPRSPVDQLAGRAVCGALGPVPPKQRKLRGKNLVIVRFSPFSTQQLDTPFHTSLNVNSISRTTLFPPRIEFIVGRSYSP